jgi:Flp pilus assembly protein protease CpaA
MLTYVPAAIALWLAFNLFVVLWLGGGESHRSPDVE